MLGWLNIIGPFLATILAALVAFLGVLVTLQEERKKAREEREFLVKQKALVSAVESVTRFLIHYATLPDRYLPKDGTVPDECSEISVALSCLHFYCDIETIKHSITMSQTLSNSYASVLKAKMPVMFIEEEIKTIELQITNLEKLNSQIQQKVLALLSSDPSNRLLISHRQQQSTISENISELSERKVELIKRKYHTTEACRDVMRKDLKEVHEILGKLLLTARRVLIFPTADRQYTTMLHRSTELALINMDSLLNEIRAEVAKKIQ